MLTVLEEHGKPMLATDLANEMVKRYPDTRIDTFYNGMANMFTRGEIEIVNDVPNSARRQRIYAITDAGRTRAARFKEDMAGVA